MTVRTAYPYRTLRLWTSGDQPVLDVWLGYTPVDAEQQYLGDDVFRAWFSKVTIESETEEKLVLRAPTKFFASRLMRDFEIKMLKAWRNTTLPGLNCIEILFS